MFFKVSKIPEYFLIQNFSATDGAVFWTGEEIVDWYLAETAKPA